MAKRWSVLLLLLSTTLSANVIATAGSRVVSMPVQRRAQRGRSLRKRTMPESVMVQNNVTELLYSISVSVGSNAQQVELSIDTSSSDIWMFGEAAYSSVQEPTGGYFDPSQSSSYQALGPFQIQYASSGASVSGNYFSDSYSVGGIKLSDLTMALATNVSNVYNGMMGIGFTSNGHPGILDVMVGENIIASRSFSLYLQGSEASSSIITFGGYIPAAVSGPMTVLDLQPDAQSGNVSSFTVAWSSLGITPSGSSGTTVISSDDYPVPAVLDPGTPFMFLPPDIFNQVSGYFGAVFNSEFGWIVQCSNPNLGSTLDFGFGGLAGATISVNASNLAIPAGADENELNIDGIQYCYFGLTSSDDGAVVLGDAFLQSAYVIFDLDAEQVAIAQACNENSDTDVQEIASGTDLGSILGTGTGAGSTVLVATSVTVTQTVTNQIPAGRITATASGVATSFSSTSLSGVVTTMPRTVHAASSHSSAASSSSKAAAVSMHSAVTYDLSMLLFTVLGLFASGSVMMLLF